MKKILLLLFAIILLASCKFNGSMSSSDYIMVWEIDPSQQVSIQVTAGSPNISPGINGQVNPGYPYEYCTTGTDNWMVVNVYGKANAQDYITTTTIAIDDDFPQSQDSEGNPDGVLIFTYVKDTIIDNGTRHIYTIKASQAVSTPPIISNGWESGMDNSNTTLVTPGSYWVQDYGFDDLGRWEVDGDAIYQSTDKSANAIQPTYGSRAYPVHLTDNSYDLDSLAPGVGFEGVWQIDIKIGSNGATNNLYCETFYLAERANLSWGPANYSDGSDAGGDGGHSREIDIMETKWNGGSSTEFGPQVNLPNGDNTGWNPSSKYINTRMANWMDVGGAPTSDFITFGCCISGGNLWFYAYKADGTQWYCSDAIPVNNTTYTQKSPFVPYIGTWTDESTSSPGGFKTGYKNFVYKTASQIGSNNPKENPELFGSSLLK